MKRKRKCSHYLQIPQTPRSPYTTLSSTEQSSAESNQGSGLDQQLPPGAYSKTSGKPSRHEVKAHVRPRGLSAICSQATLKVYIADDNSDVYQDRFMSASRNEQGIVSPTLILLALRLGIDRVTTVYWEGLKAVLQFPQSVGIAGYAPDPARASLLIAKHVE